MKKILLLLALSFTLVKGMAYSIAADGIYYQIISAGVLEVTQGDLPYSGYVNIPDSVRANGKMYSVEAIGDRAFNACAQLTSLHIPAGVKRIGHLAFASCTSLHFVNLPAALREIGDAAFYGCSSLVSMSLPASLSTIGKDAFARCPMLERFAVDEQNAYFSAVDHVLYDKKVTRLIAFPNAKDDVFTLPRTVTAIADGAFSHCVSLTSVGLPQGLKTIGDAAFYGCKKLQTISLPSSLTSIGCWAFSECESLTFISLPALLTTLGDDAFSFCSALTDINVDGANPNFVSDEGVLFDKKRATIIAYPGGKGPSYSVPQSVTRISNHAFYGCVALQHITIHQDLVSIEDDPFVFCENLTDIDVASDNGKYSSSEGILYNKEQTDIVTVPKGREGVVSVPSSVSRISTGAFLCNEKLQAVSLPQSVQTIGDYAFLGCYQLATVNIPSSLSSIGRGAFSDCIGLQEIVCCGQPLAVTPFLPVISDQTRLFVPRGERSDFLQSDGWKDFRQIEEYGLHADYLQLNRGRLQNVPVRLEGTLPLTALQMDIEVPEGMQIARDATGQFMVSLAGHNANTHRVSCAKTAEGLYSIVVMSMENAVLEQTDTLLFLGVNIDEDCLAGNYEMGVSNIVLTYMTHQLYGEAMQQNWLADWHVQNYMGDVNHDGLVNVADVVLTLRHIQSLPTEDFHFLEADVNNSGVITVSDAVGIVDIIQQEHLFSTAGLTDVSQAAVADRILASEVHILQGKKEKLEIELLNGVGNYTAQQFDLTLPPGVTIAKNAAGEYDCQMTTRYDSHQLYIMPLAESFYEGNTYRIVCASYSLKDISQRTGALLKLHLVAEEDLPDETHTGRVHHIVFADKEAHAYELPNANFEVSIGNQTGIDEVSTPRKAANIYNLQGLLVRTQATSLEGLQPGIYIMNGRKYVVK